MKNIKSIIVIFIVIMSILVMFIISIDDYKHEEHIMTSDNDTKEKCYQNVSQSNLTYSYLNITTGEINKVDSGIPVYNKIPC